MFYVAFILYGYVKQCKIEMATAIQIVWQNGRQKCGKSVNKNVYGKLGFLRV